jgi:hypothetical protein
VDPSGLTWLIFDSEAYTQLFKDIFIGDTKAPAVDPNSLQGLRSSDGLGPAPLYDANGNLQSPGDAVLEVGKAVPKGILTAAAMMLGPGEEEEATDAAGGLWKALKNKLRKPKCPAKTPNFKELEAVLDATGKVHGPLPNPNDLAQYHPEDLEKLLQELEQSVQERISKTAQLGSDPQHAARQAQEQQLIEALGRHLGGR